MIKVISGILSAVIYNILCYLFFDTFFNVKIRARYIGAIVLSVAATIITMISFGFAYHTIVKQIIVIIVVSISMKLLFDIKMISAVLFGLLFHAFVILIEFLLVQILNYACSYELLYYQSPITIIFLSIISQMVQFLAIVILRKKYKKISDIIIRKKELALFFAFPIFTIITLLLAVSQYGLIRDNKRDVFLMYMAFGLAFMNFTMYYLVCYITKKDSFITQAEVIKEKGAGDLKLYEKLNENYDLLQRRAHEFDNELAVIQSLAEDNNTEKIRSYIAEICHNNITYQKCIETNNPVIDAIINTKYREALQKNITFTIKINDLSNVRMADEDITVILSNLLNNAFEATISTETRIVRFKCELNDENILISVSNSSEKPPVKENGNYVSTKTDTSHPHGIGSKNTKDVITKYKGDYFEEYDNGFFTFTTIINNSKCQLAFNNSYITGRV